MSEPIERECELCRTPIEMLEAGGRVYAFDADTGDLHGCWSELPEGEDVLVL